MSELLDGYNEAYDAIADKFDELEEAENLILGLVKNATNGQLTSKVTDGRTFSLNLEATERALSQTPRGVVRALSMDDMGKGLMAQLALEKYFIPNDNIPYAHLTKLRMADFAASIHGVSHMMYDICYRDDYAGVATHLLPVRAVVPQKGRFSVKDCSKVWVESFVDPKDFQEMVDRSPDSWDKEQVASILKGSDESKEDRKMSAFEKAYNTQRLASGKVRVITEYQAGVNGNWVTINPHTGKAARTIPNPHESGRIPISSLHSVPFGDNFFGISAVQRAKPVQQTMDALIKLYLRGVEMSVFPPIIAPPSVLKYGLNYNPGELWIEQVQGSIRRFETNPQGMETFDKAYNFFNGALLNQYGTTDTTASQGSSLDPGYGRTPAAIKKLSERQNTKDSWKKAMLDDFIGDLYDGVIDLMMNQSVVPMPIELFEKEIEQIAASGYPDIMENLEVSSSGNYARLNVDPEYVKGARYRFYIEPGTTEKEDNAAQFENISNALQTLTKIPGVIEEIKKTGNVFDIGAAATELIRVSGIDNAVKVVRPMTEEERTKYEQEQEVEKQMAMVQQVQGAMGAQTANNPEAPAGGQEMGQQMEAGLETQAAMGMGPEAADPMTASLNQALAGVTGAQGGRPPA